MKLAHRVAVAATMLTFFGCAAEGQRYEAPQGASSSLDQLFHAERAIAPFATGMTGATVVGEPQIDLGLEANTPNAPQAATRFAVPLRENLTVEVQLDRVVADGASHVWTGHVLGDERSQATFARRGEALAGTIRTHGSVFTITPHEGVTTVAEWDAEGPSEAAPVIPEGLGASAAAGETGDGNGDAQVDVLVLYTEQAAAAGGADAVDAMIDVTMAEVNQSLRDSGVRGQFHLVGTDEVSFDEEGDIEGMLEQLAGRGDGVLDEAHELRDALHADLVVLMVENAGDYAGVGYQMTAANAGRFADSAFSVVTRDHAGPNLTLAHELGHNLGADHDRDHASEGYRADSHGHQDKTARFRTIMAYPCGEVVCQRVARWSNPADQFAGAPTGVAGESNNAGTLEATMRLAASFREAPLEPEEPRQPADLLEPLAAHGPLSGSSQWFTWQDVNAQAYYLMVGRFPGDRSYHSATAGTATSVRVDGLPENGSRVGVRLWTLFGTEWSFQDYELDTASRTVEYAPELRFPANGQPLESTMTWFRWDPVPNAQGYRIEVGTLDQPGSIYDREVDGTEVHVVGLPSDGAGVFVRLSARFDQGWVSSESIHPSYEAPLAATFEWPMHGAMVDGGKVEFMWTDANTGTPHQIAIMDADGVVLAHEAVQGGQASLPVATEGDAVAVLYTFDPNLGWMATSIGMQVSHGGVR